MYVIDKQANRIAKLDARTFKALGFNEVDHLQEWLAHDPSALGEDLLIIQKEFDGFDGTYERLDLLALDKEGNLVIIENKLDDSGKDVTWQAIKYASYCSTLKKEDIRSMYQKYLDKYSKGASAEARLTEFFERADYKDLLVNEGAKQRIILVAAKFRKEVTSAVIWLMNYGIRVQCFKVTPFQHDDRLYLNLEQVLPTRDTEELVISMASKVQDEIATHEDVKVKNPVRLEFWTYFLQHAQTKSSLYTSTSPSAANWIGVGLGMTGVSMSLVATSTLCRSEVFINRGDKEENKECFDHLFAKREQIEKEFGAALEWERMDDRITCRVKHELAGVDMYKREDWQRMTTFLVDSTERMHKAFKGPVKELNDAMKRKQHPVQ